MNSLPVPFCVDFSGVALRFLHFIYRYIFTKFLHIKSQRTKKRDIITPRRRLLSFGAQQEEHYVDDEGDATSPTPGY